MGLELLESVLSDALLCVVGRHRVSPVTSWRNICMSEPLCGRLSAANGTRNESTRLLTGITVELAMMQLLPVQQITTVSEMDSSHAQVAVSTLEIPEVAGLHADEIMHVVNTELLANLSGEAGFRIGFVVAPQVSSTVVNAPPPSSPP